MEEKRWTIMDDNNTYCNLGSLCQPTYAVPKSGVSKSPKNKGKNLLQRLTSGTQNINSNYKPHTGVKMIYERKSITTRPRHCDKT